MSSTYVLHDKRMGIIINTPVWANKKAIFDGLSIRFLTNSLSLCV